MTAVAGTSGSSGTRRRRRRGLTLGCIDDTTLDQVKVMATYPGDFNLDGVVDNQDKAIWFANAFSGTTWQQGDANHDGVVDGLDRDILSCARRSAADYRPIAPRQVSPRCPSQARSRSWPPPCWGCWLMHGGNEDSASGRPAAFLHHSTCCTMIVGRLRFIYSRRRWPRDFHRSGQTFLSAGEKCGTVFWRMGMSAPSGHSAELSGFARPLLRSRIDQRCHS